MQWRKDIELGYMRESVLKNHHPRPRYQLKSSSIFFQDYLSRPWRSAKAFVNPGVTSFQLLILHTCTSPRQNPAASCFVIVQAIRLSYIAVISIVLAAVILIMPWWVCQQSLSSRKIPFEAKLWVRVMACFVCQKFTGWRKSFTSAILLQESTLGLQDQK
jgi:hypothetical protein